MLTQFEPFFIAYAQLVTLGRKVEEKLGQNSSAKFASYRCFEYECVLHAAQVLLECNLGTDSLSDKSPNISPKIEQYLTLAAKNTIESKQQSKGFPYMAAGYDKFPISKFGKTVELCVANICLNTSADYKVWLLV